MASINTNTNGDGEIISRLQVNNQGFVFDPQTGQGYTANDTGRFVLKAIAENTPPVKILDRIQENFDVTLEEAEKDMADFMDQLRCLGLSRS